MVKQNRNVMTFMDVFTHLSSLLLSRSRAAGNQPSEIEQIFDTERDRYQIISVGWNNQKRVYSTMIHLDIRNEKVWIQQNTTEIDIASELVEMGVKEDDIVIGFHTPKMRQSTNFAVG
jgi:hypothetical protein